MVKILIGADPELFVRDSKGRSRSPHGMIPGTKAEPHKVKHGAVQVDDMALEFNIEPAATPKQFQRNINAVLEQMRAMIPAGYEFDISPTADFHGNHMRAQPEEAKMLGCEPDFNAYTGEENQKPDGNVNFRTASGHVHIGFTEDADVRDEEHKARVETLIRQLDLFLGIPSLSWDDDQKRRLLYGKAGAYRPKSYGCEYRTLSNAWLKDPKLQEFVFKQTKAAVADLMAGNALNERDYTRVRRAVDSGYIDFTTRRIAAQHNVPLEA